MDLQIPSHAAPDERGPSDEIEPSLPAEEPNRFDRSWIAFVAVEVFAFVFYLYVGRSYWFYRDDWLFLGARSTNLSDLLRNHGGHLTALPLLAFRILYRVVGLHSYAPYQLLCIGLHLAAGWLLRIVMRRAGASGWISTAAASLYVLFRTGSQNTLSAFQITFEGALVLGLAQLLLADHRGRVDRRDAYGILCGLAALMCSNVGVAMIVAVGVACLITRGWRVAALHTAPLGIVYAAWWVTHAREGAQVYSTPGPLVDWSATGIRELFDALGQVPGVGWALGALLVAGLAVAWRTTDRDERRVRLALPAALIVAGLFVLATSGLQRVGYEGVAGVKASRYQDLLAATFVPALAVAASALVAFRRYLAPIVFVLLLIGIPGNLMNAPTYFPTASHYAQFRQTMLSLPRMKLAKRVPRSLRPEPVEAPGVTIGWLLDGVRFGRVPPPRHPTPGELATNTLRLSLQQLVPATSATCGPLATPRMRRLAPGQHLRLRGRVLVSLITDDGIRSDPVPFGAGFDQYLLANIATPLRLRIVPIPSRVGRIVRYPDLCGPR